MQLVGRKLFNVPIPSFLNSLMHQLEQLFHLTSPYWQCTCTWWEIATICLSRGSCISAVANDCSVWSFRMEKNPTSSHFSDCVSNKLMGLGEAAGNSQLCSFPLECSAAELIVSKALQWIQKPFALLKGRENGKENASVFSPHSFFLSFLLLCCF